MNGFVAQNSLHTDSFEGPKALSMFNKTTLPVLNTLAVNFAMFDQYFADLPGPTMPNRYYFMSGTSHGLVDNNDEAIGLGLPQHSIFDRMDKNGIDWRVYAETVPSVLGLLRARTPGNLAKMRGMEEFFESLKNENLKQISWLEPSYLGFVLFVFSLPPFFSFAQHLFFSF